MAIYTCVLLDVDNTILDFDAAERQALTDMIIKTCPFTSHFF